MPAKGGYMGKILRINLTTKKISTIETDKYAEMFMGGHGIATAIFFDLVRDKTITAFHPDNPLIVMTGPLTGTLAPTSGRVQFASIGPQGWPIEWYTRGGMGGRFGPMLKFAGWDGIVIEGKAEKPVWIWICDEDVEIRDATGLWGLDTYETQEEIWLETTGSRQGDWLSMERYRERGRMTTQLPAIACIGQAGENLSRIATVQHDASNAAGQGGFGAVMGSKNLKAIAVWGSGTVPVANPKRLIELREEIQQRVWRPGEEEPPGIPTNADAPGSGTLWGLYGGGGWAMENFVRPLGCFGCPWPCRANFRGGLGAEAQCVEALFYAGPDFAAHGDITSASPLAATLLEKYGINAFDVIETLTWTYTLYRMGFLGPNGEVKTELPFDAFGEAELAEEFLRAIAYREDIGDALAEGGTRAAFMWGREKDLETGLLHQPYHGYTEHYDPRIEVEWGYGTILDSRDINEHDFNMSWWAWSGALAAEVEPALSAKEYAERFGEVIGDPFALDYSLEGIYSEHMARTVYWHRHYVMSWKHSAILCDWRFANIVDAKGPDFRGLTPWAEPAFFEAVTGIKLSFEDGLEIGRRIWNLQRAIHVLQGRTREHDQFTLGPRSYIYNVPAEGGSANVFAPAYENGEWVWKYVRENPPLSYERVEAWKDKYYRLEGWDVATGWPTRETLEALGLGYVADELAAKGKLPSRKQRISRVVR